MPSLDDLNAAIEASDRQARDDSFWQRQAKRLQGQLAEKDQLIDKLTAIDVLHPQVSPFKDPPKDRRKHHGIVNIVLSDLHFDEVIKLEQVNGLNAYDRRIAQMRLEATVHRLTSLSRDYITGITYDAVQVWLGGDNLSGNIHDELGRTNEGQHVIDSVDYWADHLAGALSVLADKFARVHVVCQYGNHGRSSKKPEAKDPVRSSFDWLLYRMVIKALNHDQRITWNVPESLVVIEQVFGTRYLFEHGDNFRGGDQISGPIRPVTMGAYRRRETIAHDRIIVGHFHQYANTPVAVMNGSLIGYSEYAIRRGFRFEVPQQAFWIETPENGPLFSTPIRPADPAREGWG